MTWNVVTWPPLREKKLNRWSNVEWKAWACHVRNMVLSQYFRWMFTTSWTELALWYLSMQCLELKTCDWSGFMLWTDLKFVVIHEIFSVTVYLVIISCILLWAHLHGLFWQAILCFDDMKASKIILHLIVYCTLTWMLNYNMINTLSFKAALVKNWTEIWVPLLFSTFHNTR